MGFKLVLFLCIISILAMSSNACPGCCAAGPYGCDCPSECVCYTSFKCRCPQGCGCGPDGCVG